MSRIIIPIDWHAVEPPEPPLDASWVAQVPRDIALDHSVELAYLEGWREGPEKAADDEALRSLAPKELRRCACSGDDPAELLKMLARFWPAVEADLDRDPPAAILLWNCGNVDQGLWARLAKERGIPVMHCEHGWLPHTRIFDASGAYVTGWSGWDELALLPATELLGSAIIRLWRRARQSKHLQGVKPSERAQAFCGKGPALLVGTQLDTDGAAVYNEAQFASQRDFVRKCLTWPGPVIVKEHPQAGRIEWHPAFVKERQLCRMETEAKGGMWLGANESIHELVPMVAAVAAINSNLLLEAAMMGKPALSFGGGPHSARGFTVDLGSGEEWPLGEQTAEQLAAVRKHVARMEPYLSPVGCWLAGWDDATFWGFPFWEDAPDLLRERWRSLLA